MAEILFQEEKKAIEWLQKQPLEVRCAISSRATLRVCSGIAKLDGELFHGVALAVFRAALTASVRAQSQTDRNKTLKEAASSAASSSELSTIFPSKSNEFATISTAVEAARLAASSARLAGHASALAASSAVFSASNSARNASLVDLSLERNSLTSSADRAADLTLLASSIDSDSSGLTKFDMMLWPENKVPSAIAKNHIQLLKKLDTDYARWGFWREWYLGMWEGTFNDWELALEITKLPNNTWKDGAETVGAEIVRLRAEILSKRLPQSEQLVFNNITATFSIKPINISKPDLLGATLIQVQDALGDVMALPSNGLHDGSREVRVIRRTLTKYGNDPQQIEMGFVSAHAGLTRQILVDELPASEENLALQSALEEGALGIRATHPDVAENRKIVSQQRFVEMSPEQKDILHEALPVLKAISDQSLSEDWDHDIPALINTSTGPLPSGAPALPGIDEATRVFSRAAKIGLAMKAGNVVRIIDNNAGYKAGRIVITLSGLVGLGLALLSII